MLQPKYILWSKGFPLSVDQCELRDGAPTSKHPEIHSKNPNIDRDAISDRFFKATGRNKVKTFQAAAGRKATRIALFMSEEHFQAIIAHLEQLEASIPSRSSQVIQVTMIY